MDKTRLVAAALLAVTLSGATGVAFGGTTGFVLDPATSTASIDYVANGSITITAGSSGSSTDSFTLNRHFSEPASGTLSATPGVGALAINGGTIDVAYTGAPLTANLSFFGGLLGLDLSIQPKTLGLTLPAFDAGPPGIATPTEQPYGPATVGFDSLLSLDATVTLTGSGVSQSFSDSYVQADSDTGDFDSRITLDGLGNMTGLLLGSAGPYSVTTSDSYSENTSIGTVTVDFTVTETWSNLQTNLTAVPLPAGLWLFASAVAGLFGTLRRRTSV